MNELIILGIGMATTVFLSIFYFIIRKIKKKLRCHVLRFEEIKDKFE